MKVRPCRPFCVRKKAEIDTMETFEEHYASMKAAILKHMPGADMALIDKAVEYADVATMMTKLKHDEKSAPPN